MRMYRYSSESGFTLIEVLVVLLLAGVLAAIAAPSWVGFTNTRRLNAAQATVYNAIKRAQSEAKTRKTDYRVSFMDTGNGPEFAVHPVAQKTNLAFLPLVSEGGVNANRSVLVGCVSPSYSIGTCAGANNPDTIRFTGKGNYEGLLNTSVVLRATQGGPQRRCVTVTTILGATRSLTERSPGGSCNDT